MLGSKLLVAVKLFKEPESSSFREEVVVAAVAVQKVCRILSIFLLVSWRKEVKSCIACW